MNIIAVILARSGSKGLPHKNVKVLGDKPLMAWTINSAGKSKLIEKIVLSTDSDEYYKIAKSFDENIIYHKRTPELAEDVPSEWVLLDVVKNLSNLFDDDSILVLLQPTTPFITSKDFDTCIQKLINNPKMNCCISVKSVSEYPEWMIKQKENDVGTGNEISGELGIRQNLEKRWIPNGGVYAVRKNFLEKEKKIIDNDNLLVHEMSRIRSLDIDHEEDFIICESLVKSGIID